MIDDLGEVAQLATEYINSLENLPQEVQHIIKEIEHKDAKVQEMLPKLAAREGQLRELLAKKEVLTDVDKVKMDKLGEKIKVDYTRADEWSTQKEMLSKKLWRSVVSHQRRLYQEIDKISPVLIKQVESQLPIQNGALGSASSSTSLANLPALLAGFKSPSIDGEMLFAAGSGGGLKRKHGSSSQLARDSPTLSTKGGRQSSIDRLSPALTLTTSGSSNINGVNAFVPTTGHASISKKALKSSGLSTMLAAKVEPDIELDADGEADEGAGGDGEKDTKLYCHCQRVSFGEMIGCDNDDCPYEWFHLSCVGLSKPLPQTWYCEHCREKMEREKSEKPAKKRKR